MYNSVKVVETLLYGYDQHHCYMKLKLIDPLFYYEHKKYVIKGYLISDKEMDFALPLTRFECNPFNITANDNKQKFNELVEAGSAAFDDVLEIMISFDKARLVPGQKLSLYVKIFSADGMEIERVPEIGALTVPVPDNQHILSIWDV